LRQYTGIGAGLLLLGLGVVGPAAAQALYPLPPGLINPALQPYEIMRAVSSHGLTPVTRPVRRGRNYVLLATDKSGQEMRVAVDARLGDIVGLRPPIPGEPYGPPIANALSPAAVRAPMAALPPSANRPPGPAADFALPPRPIPNVPNPGVGAAAPNPPNPDAAPPPPAAAPAPSRSAATQPSLPPLPPPPPLPRARPTVAEAQAPAESPQAPPAVKRPGVPPLAPNAKPSEGEIE
jgi:hypothetical protein